MTEIKVYKQFEDAQLESGFRIKRMEDIFNERSGRPDDPHRHNYFTMLVVEEGRGEHIVDFQHHALGKRQVYFVAPGQVHAVVEEERSKGYVLTFSLEFLIHNDIPLRFIEDLNLFNNYGENPPLELPEAEFEKLDWLMEQICIYADGFKVFKEQAISSLLKLALISCNNACAREESSPHAYESGCQILSNFRRLVDEHFKKWHGVSDYANELNISSEHLNRTIKSLLGRSAKEYIQSRLTIEAKRLLFFSDLSNKEIAYELGFSEPNNFSSFFKNCTGQTPSAFKAEV